VGSETHHPDPGSSEGQTGGHIAHAVVERAAARVRDTLPRESRAGQEAQWVASRLDQLVAALTSDEQLLGADSDVGGSLRLLDLIYAEIVDSWRDGAPDLSKGEILRTLDAFQRVREALSPRAPEHSSLLWTGYQDTNLVVELAHDLRSPLTSIIFLTEALTHGGEGELNDLQRRQLAIIYSAALSLVSTASDVIELGRGGSRLLERRPSPFSIAEVQESITDILKPVVEEKKLSLRSVSPRLDHRLGHPVALSRVLLNLTSNALRYTDAGFVEISSTADGPTRVTFSVRDSGPGIDEQAVNDLFEPLRRNRSSNRFGFSGSGLGLAICRRLVRAMGGELNYETARGWGTRFYFDLDLPAAPNS
jgi:signal transduction histidine kinase